MKMSLKIDKRVIDKLEKVNLQMAILRGAQIGMMETAAHVQRSKVSGQLLNVRSGALRRSVSSRAMIQGNRIHAFVGANTPYARIQEEGGTVVPVRSQYLTIPTQYAKTAAGIVRGGARSFANTFVRRTKSGKLMIFQKRGNGVVPLFSLVKSVKIKPKRYLKTGLQDKLGVIYELITREIMRAVG